MSKLAKVSISATDPAVVRAADVLTSCFNAVVDQVPQALEPGNSDGVHDMRVATRRLLGALRDLGPLFQDGKPKGLTRDVKVLADTLGSIRDHDVALIELEKLRSENSDTLIDEGLRGLIESRNARRAAAGNDLREVLTETRISGINKRLLEFVGRHNSVAGNEEPTFSDIGRDIIRKRLASFLKGARYIYDPFDSASLHKLRLETKRLRYAIQSFADPSDADSSFIAGEIGKLQTRLGDIHDCDIWIRKLARSLKRRFKSGKTTGSDYAAAEWLLIQFAKKRSKSYRDALGIWNSWRHTDFLTRVSRSTEGPTSVTPLIDRD